ncbi:zinc protease [Pseudolabrys sp. Root1462]|uniref:M16 family metallopeptidase n=1 Tax=Pseudolabrys sp. Root1462 TaxID=1736466 RepID=UPI000702B548|nr:pitrilysin family protein [Pseudolabrys sp. Root1462]KQY99924.1 zinc protease [Pseudolabrys sp. Root1462]
MAAAVTLLLCPAGAGAAEQSGPKISDFKLDNGLELVVIPDHRAPVITHMIWYKVGAADETAGKSGLAHFLEHLMFKGTAMHPAGQFSSVVARMGGQENAFTSSDYTGYYQRVPSEKLEEVMGFEADRMTGLVLTDAVVLPERDVILEERNQRMENNPRARLGEQMDAALFLNSPYGRPVIGWRHEMEGLTKDDAIGFYRRFYGPNNAVVVVAGDVDPQQALAFAKQTYGKLKPHADIAPRARPLEPPPAAVRSLTLADPRVEQPTLQRSYLVPSFHTAKPGESEALEVLAHILGAGSNSRLYRALVVDKHVAVSAGAYYDSSAYDMSKFGVYGAPVEGVSLTDLESATDAVIAEVIDKGVTADELDRSKSRLVADAIYAQDNQATMARWYGQALMTGATVADVQSWPDRIRAVTAAQVQNAARQWLERIRSVTGYLVKDTGPAVNKAERTAPAKSGSTGEKRS